MQGEAIVLFVYGTLRADVPAPSWSRGPRGVLRRSGERVGAASAPGRLLDLGCHPAMVAPMRPGERVHGEAWRLTRRALGPLDAYEGADYRRQRCRAQLVDGRVLDVWVYLWRGRRAGLPAIPGGDWRALAKSRRRG